MSGLRLDADGRPVLRVSELVAHVRALLDGELGEVLVEGEIGSLHRSRPGHVYFELKDPSAQLRAVLFRGTAVQLEVEPEDGMQVRVRGHLDLYPPRGQLQLVIEDLEPCGAGALWVAFERMRERLAAQGLFEPDHKRPLPAFPRRIGVVTSRHGAALHDFLRGLRQRRADLDVVLFDARVQGEGAWRELVRGLHLLAARPGIEAIVLTRGGGSIEDLWAFNREELVRAIFELDVPVVSAVGHEVDVVLTDLVADVRAPTPTAAAATIAPDAARLRERLQGLARRLRETERARVQALRHRLDALARGLVHPAQRIAALQRRLTDARARLRAAVARSRERHGERLRALGGRLDALSPLAVLARGYSLTRRERDGVIVKASDEVEPGAGIRVRLARGGLRARVTDRVEGG